MKGVVVGGTGSGVGKTVTTLDPWLQGTGGPLYLGRVPLCDDLDVPDRNLGLHTGEKPPIDSGAIDEAADHLRTDAGERLRGYEFHYSSAEVGVDARKCSRSTRSST